MFPGADEREFHNHQNLVKNKVEGGSNLSDIIQMSYLGNFPATLSFSKQLFKEVTDKYYSLTALALAITRASDPLEKEILQTFPKIGLDDNLILIIVRNWIRQKLEDRCFLPPGADIINLAEGWYRPKGLDLNRPTSVFSESFSDYLNRILNNEQTVANLEEWFRDTLVRRTSLFNLTNDLYFLQPLGLCIELKLKDDWFRCQDCGTIYLEHIQSLCPSCLGELVPAEEEYLESRTGFYRDQVMNAFDPQKLEPFGIATAEHSAQLNARDDIEAFNRAEEYELRFQDIHLGGKPSIDVLSCTTTMEVGIDIGTLSGVALRNVPPHVANYQQRSGRAGRRGRSTASVLTFAHGSSHDSFYYQNPEKIITGEVLVVTSGLLLYHFQRNKRYQ